MPLIYVVLPAAIILIVAYVSYGKLVGKLFQLDALRKTPAHQSRDGIDFEPIAPGSLLPQHFSAIAAAGPIVGPILAGLTFGWLPALLWILIGSIFIGGVHDFSALVASIRHKARSIAHVVREHMSRRSYLLFLTFIWIALIYIIVAFTDVTAQAFVGPATAENGGVGGGAIATSSVLYLVLTLLMGLCVRYLKISMNLATAFFLVLVAGAIWIGPSLAFDMATTLNISNGQARKVWDLILLAYCLVAGVLPVWLLLQPRGQLGGYFLYAALGAGALGLILGGGKAEYPMFLGWEVTRKDGSIASVFPLLFITIACGACSGFHSLIASGTTSKQLQKETDALPIGYGAMLLEAMVAIVSLCCVMMFAQGAKELSGTPNQIYAQGIAKFLSTVSLPVQFGVAFALMAFTTFVYDTLDVCTRLGRYIIQELTGLHNRVGRWLGTALTAGVPVYFLLRHPTDATVPVWRVFWDLFGASNQLLAALTLLGITMWVWQTRRVWWVWLVIGLPTVFMYTMSTWALISMTLPRFQGAIGLQLPTDPTPWIGLVLLALALLMLLEAVLVITKLGQPPTTNLKQTTAS